MRVLLYFAHMARCYSALVHLLCLSAPRAPFLLITQAPAYARSVPTRASFRYSDLCAVLSTVFIRLHSRLSVVCRPSEVTVRTPCSHAAPTRLSCRLSVMVLLVCRPSYSRPEVIRRLLYATGAASHAFLSGGIRLTSWWTGFLSCTRTLPNCVPCRTRVP
ncbi:hypothetical protein C8J57DRAFT_1323005 [Mycena rebaudengoi]|nr:hypothetical protein C8J57DRAFT_1323005 [Mycena rebaudengoi]